MLTLPYPPRKAFLRSLWLLSNLLTALVLGILVAVAFGPVWIAPTGVFFTALALLGRGRKDVQLKLYRMWNRVARFVGKAGFRWVLLLSHRLLLRSFGSEVSKFDAGVNLSAQTGWHTYPPAFRDASSAPPFGPIEEVAWRGWSRQYVEWSRSEGNRWALLLLPFLMMLSFFSQGKVNAVAPSKIYTLF